MLAIPTIREQEANNKWQKLTRALDKKIKENQQVSENKKSRSLYEEILIDIKKIEQIENILVKGKRVLEQASTIKEKLILERFLIKLEVSFNFFVHLVNPTEVIQQRITNFFTGIDNINATLLYSGETIYSLKIEKVEQYIKKLYTFLQVWQSLNKEIKLESLLELHEDSLKLIYASLYILENTYNYLIREKNTQVTQNNSISWETEDKLYEALLEDIEEYSEDWTEEEQKAFAKAMSNL